MPAAPITVRLAPDGRILDRLQNQANKAGNSLIVDASSAPANTKWPIIRANGDNDINPQSLLVQIQAVRLSTGVADMKAELIWGVGGAQFTAQCDIGNGAELTLAANSLTINAFNASLCPASTSYQIGASLSYGVRGGGNSGPTLTSVTQTAASYTLASGSWARNTFTIPPFASGFRVLALYNAEPYYLEVRDSAGLQLFGEYELTDPNATFPLNPGSADIRLANLSCNYTQTWRLCFDLCL